MARRARTPIPTPDSLATDKTGRARTTDLGDNAEPTTEPSFGSIGSRQPGDSSNPSETITRKRRIPGLPPSHETSDWESRDTKETVAKYTAPSEGQYSTDTEGQALREQCSRTKSESSWWPSFMSRSNESGTDFTKHNLDTEETYRSERDRRPSSDRTPETIRTTARGSRSTKPRFVEPTATNTDEGVADVEGTQHSSADYVEDEDIEMTDDDTSLESDLDTRRSGLRYKGLRLLEHKVPPVHDMVSLYEERECNTTVVHAPSHILKGAQNFDIDGRKIRVSWDYSPSDNTREYTIDLGSNKRRASRGESSDRSKRRKTATSTMYSGGNGKYWDMATDLTKQSVDFASAISGMSEKYNVTENAAWNVVNDAAWTVHSSNADLSQRASDDYSSKLAIDALGLADSFLSSFTDVGLSDDDMSEEERSEWTKARTSAAASVNSYKSSIGATSVSESGSFYDNMEEAYRSMLSKKPGHAWTDLTGTINGSSAMSSTATNARAIEALSNSTSMLDRIVKASVKRERVIPTDMSEIYSASAMSVLTNSPTAMNHCYYLQLDREEKAYQEQQKQLAKKK